MNLFFSPGACSLATHIALREADLSFELIKVDLRAKTYGNGEDYWKVNSKGSVPALAIKDDKVLTEAAVILQWIADQAPNKNLIPAAGSFERYRAMEWLNFISTEIHKGIGPLWKPNVSPEQRENILALVSKKLELLEKHFATNNYVLGQNFSVADSYLFTVLAWTIPLKIDMSAYPNINAFRKRVSERPLVLESLKAEGLLN